MAGRWDDDQVNRLFGTVMRNIAVGEYAMIGATPIDQVAEQCGVSPSAVLKLCQSDTVEHVHLGNARTMTPAQIAKFLAQYSRGGELGSRVADGTDEMALARANSAKAASRKTSKKIA